MATLDKEISHFFLDFSVLNSPRGTKMDTSTIHMNHYDE